MAMKVGRRNGPSTESHARRETAPKANGHTTLSQEEVRQMIAERAYLRAAQRGFAPGGELDDWLAAEQEIRMTVDAKSITPRQDADAASAVRTRKRGPAKTVPAEVKGR